MVKIKRSQIIGEVEVCPYCMDEIGNRDVCCGEVHFETAYVVEEYFRGKPFGMYYLENEIEFIPEDYIDSNNNI